VQFQLLDLLWGAGQSRHAEDRSYCRLGTRHFFITPYCDLSKAAEIGEVTTQQRTRAFPFARTGAADSVLRGATWRQASQFGSGTADFSNGADLIQSWERTVLPTDLPLPPVPASFRKLPWQDYPALYDPGARQAE
jgi:hypothetical protein